ncbi:DinB family protein [Ilumatobacter sp.]|uniref:DinB family protein n=1 Tax=Ilumatobacter sp. TaxID=1967498 RepID=UPI0037533867
MAVKLPTPTDSDVRTVLDRQALVMFELADEVLADVTLEECLWRVSDQSWTVHEVDGRFVGELADEPPDLPTPSLAWTMWHPIWWLSVLLGHAHGREIPAPESIEWPGPGSSVATIRELWAELMLFASGLDDDDLGSGDLSRFPYTDGRPFVHTLGWASMELVKNLSEMCMLRRIAKDVSER